jgi:hypothetical protein
MHHHCAVSVSLLSPAGTSVDRTTRCCTRTRGEVDGANRISLVRLRSLYHWLDTPEAGNALATVVQCILRYATLKLIQIKLPPIHIRSDSLQQLRIDVPPRQLTPTVLQVFHYQPEQTFTVRSGIRIDFRSEFMRSVFKNLRASSRHALPLNRVVFAANLRAKKVESDIANYLVIVQIPPYLCSR